ncbi:hypothetical protein ACFLVZ_03275 [Chloroflexota bacterium]
MDTIVDISSFMGYGQFMNTQIALFGLIGVLMGIAATSFYKWIDRKERFRVMTFEKRLEIHQRAYYWNQKIYSELSSKNANTLRNIAQEIQEWWNNNSLLLDEKSRTSMISVINSTNRYARGLDQPEFATGIEQIWDVLNTNLEDIETGIGAEHLSRVTDNNENQSQQLGHRLLQIITTIPSPNWVENYLFRSLFTIAVLVFVGLTIFAAFKIEINEQFTQAIRASFVFNSFAAFLGLMVAYWLARNRIVALLSTVAIELFISGMFFELISFIEKAHL